MTKSTPPFMTPAVKSDVAFLAADLAIGFRSITLALLSIRAGDMGKLDKHIAAIDETADDLWKTYHELRGVLPDDE